MQDNHTDAILSLLSIAAHQACSESPFPAMDTLQSVSALLNESNSELFQPICLAIGFAASSMQTARLTDACKSREANTRVYFMQRSDGLIKIGFTQNVEARLKQISGMAASDLVLLATTSGGQEEERKLHRQFAAHQCHGEWFHPAKELLEYIKGLADSVE